MTVMRDQVVKVVGADVELGNFMQGQDVNAAGAGTGHLAAQLLLREIEGVPSTGVTAAGYRRWRESDARPGEAYRYRYRSSSIPHRRSNIPPDSQTFHGKIPRIEESGNIEPIAG